MISLTCITIGCYTIRIEVRKIWVLCFFSRRIGKALLHNIHQSLIKNIPYIVVADKMKYYRLQQNFN